MPEPKRLRVTGEGLSLPLEGRAADMAIALARHAVELNRHEQGVLELAFAGDKLTVVLRATLERSSGQR